MPVIISLLQNLLIQNFRKKLKPLLNYSNLCWGPVLIGTQTLPQQKLDLNINYCTCLPGMMSNDVMYILHLALKTRISWLCDNFSVGSLYENSIKWQHNTVILQRMLTKLLWSIMLRPILCKFYLPHVSYLNSYEIKLQHATLVNNTIFFITYKCDRILECQQFSSKQHNFFAYNHVSYQKRKSVIISQILCCLC